MTQTTRRAKLFKNGASQAVRLPGEFRFAGDEVFATRDDRTGDVILSTQPGGASWAAFFELVDGIADIGGYMDERPLNTPPVDRPLFDAAD